MKFSLNIINVISVALISSYAAIAEERKPNIIFLLADDQNVQSVGIYGNDEVKTPEMDKLGQEGVIFDKHYNTTAICMASRASIFTGMYEYKTGTNFSHGHMRSEIWAKSYPVLLREAGYLTAFAGKFGIEIMNEEGKDKSLRAEDFDMWGGAKGQSSYKTSTNTSMKKYAEQFPHSTLSYAAFGKDAIREAKRLGKPFCLSISYKAPHRPVTPDPQFDHIYKDATFTKPENYGRAAGAHLAPQSKTGRQYPRFKGWDYDKNYDGVMAKYYQQIYAIDVSLGIIRAELEAQGVSDNTVIIYTSDNGFLCGAHGYGSKVLPYEESSRAPLMIYDPRSKSAGKQKRSSELTGNIDFGPTILELAGLPIPANMDGVSLIPVLSETKGNLRDSLILMNTYGPAATTNMTIVTNDVKYNYWWYGDKTMEPVEELFNLSKDPLEMTNSAKDPEYKEQLNRMRQKYDDQLVLWKKEAEPDYQQYVTKFDRFIPWQEKDTKEMSTKNKKGKSKAKSKSKSQP